MQSAVIDDILNEVKLEASDKRAGNYINRANERWESECYTRQLYSIGNEHATQAEFFEKWAKIDADRLRCKEWWAYGANPVKLIGEFRAVNREWKERRMAEMQHR